MSISKENIIKASIEILNRSGIEGLNMRAIAKELNIKAASLYWHIGSKLELYGEISEYLSSNSTFPTDTSKPKEFLIEMFKAFRNMLLSVRDSVPVFQESVPNTPRRMAIIKEVIQSLIAFGVHANNVMTVSNMLNNYVLSFVSDEARMKNRSIEEMNIFASMLGVSDDITMIGQDFDEQFLYGLRLIFAGLDAEKE
jgi:AcrR family transcriptional regulator